MTRMGQPGCREEGGQQILSICHSHSNCLGHHARPAMLVLHWIGVAFTIHEHATQPASVDKRISSVLTLLHSDPPEQQHVQLHALERCQVGVVADGVKVVELVLCHEASNNKEQAMSQVKWANRSEASAIWHSKSNQMSLSHLWTLQQL